MEDWRPVVGFELQYEVSNAGRVRRLARELIRANGKRYRVAEKLLAQVAHPRGYRMVGFKVAPKTNRVFLVHRIVAQAFIPNPDGLPDVNHKDLDKTNNVVGNLEWVTERGNQRHAASHGRFHGRTNVNARFKLTPVDVDNILIWLDAGARQDVIAEQFGISQSMVSMIKTKRAWVDPESLSWA